jgi:methyl-accepting chemotaxis protein
MDQIAQAMRSIQQATAQNVAGAKQAEGAARDLAELGSQLQALVGLNHDQLGVRGNGHRR